MWEHLFSPLFPGLNESPHLNSDLELILTFEMKRR